MDRFNSTQEMSFTSPRFVVRSAHSVKEVSQLWWPLMKQLGWNRDYDDAKTHFQVAQNGRKWLLLIPSSSHRPEGCVVAFTYPNSTGWVAFFIVNPAFRGQGLGRGLWREMEASFRASGTQIIGLDGVEEQVETYTRRGFVDCARIPLMTRDALKMKPLTASLAPHDDTGEIKDIKLVDSQLLARLDLEHTGLNRSAYWTTGALLSREDAYGYASCSASTITGFILVRRCEHGHRFGPLYGQTSSQAQQLLHKAMSDLAESNGSLVAEVFGSNSEGMNVFESLGWTYAGVSYHRMWLHGKVPDEQREGGKGQKGMFAIFDAGAG